MTITATSHTIKYKCSITGRRGCPPRYKGESITKTCEECHCYKFPGIKRERCFDKNGNSTESALFPFLSGEECVASCKSEGCVSVGKFASRFACLCTDGDPCFGGESFKKKCNCVACHCDLDEELGQEVCRDSTGTVILGGSSACRQSLQQCTETCNDQGCTSVTKWGCLEAEGSVCEETGEKERITECVECNCEYVNGFEECNPINNNIVMGDGSIMTDTKLVFAKFNTIEECEQDRLSPYGSCKAHLCANSNTDIRGVSNNAALLHHAIPPANLGVRKTNILYVDTLSRDKTLAGKVIDNLEDKSIYNHSFNFSHRGFEEKPIKLILNQDYPEVFNNYISPVVSYFLDQENREYAWDETYINELLYNKDHIAESLNPNLNLIFNNLTYQTGRKIDPEDLYSGIIELLLTGKMSEFDVDYFDQVYKNQSGTDISEYERSNNNSTNDNIALGIIAETLVPADPLKHLDTDGNRHYDFMANTKAFHTDVKAEVLVELPSGDTVPLEIGALGLDITSSSTGDITMSMGDGYGYYFPLSAGSIEYALEAHTQLSSSYYTPIDALDQAINLLGEDSSMKISVSSAPIDDFGYSYPTEFESGFSLTTTTSATYFALDFSGVGSTTSPDNHMVRTLKCPYNVITDLDEITSHSIEAGTQVTEVFVHYNDPIRTYLEDSAHCELELINVDFNAFVDSKAPLNGEIIVRGNIPRALVFIPAVGSRYNPFHTKSKIQKIEHHNDGTLRVSRSCEFIPYLETVPTTSIKHASTRKYTFEEYKTYGRGPLGTSKDNHPGGVFDVDSTFFTYEVSGKQEYTNLFFSSGVYTSNAPDTNLPPTTKLVSGIINDLKSTYEYTHLTYWDIFRRLKMKDYAALQVEINSEIIKAIENGVVTGGTLVSMILSGPDESNTGLRDPTDNTKYLTEDQRMSLLSDGTIAEDTTYLSEGDRIGD